MSSPINKPERATQDRVIRLFTDTLKYQHLGDWPERAGTPSGHPC
jgi:type I restriction enzyme R subunit